MKIYRKALTVVALAAVGAAGIALATVTGGGKAKSDCYLEYGGVTATKGKTTVECTDGTACDLDGVCNNSCTFGVQICPNQTDPNLPKCTPPAGGLSSVTITRDKNSVTLNQLGLTSSACAAFPDGPVVPLKVKTNKKGTKYLKAVSNIKAVAKAQPGVKPPADTSKLKLICLPSPTPCVTTTTLQPSNGPECATANPQGGPDELDLTVTEGSDLDNGWTGTSHNFIVPIGTSLKFCLSGCDASGTSQCTGSAPVGTDSLLNGPTFGSPFPLVAGGVPVCIVNKYADTTVSGTSDIATGTITSTINLNTEVWTSSSATKVCPSCSGATLGATGTCDSGTRKNQACTTQGIVTVNSTNPPVNGDVYTLSNQCPPGDLAHQKVATLQIGLAPLTTSEAHITGPKPCQGQTLDDSCSGATCDVCPAGNPPLSGGINQYCCNNQNKTPCFPTKANSPTNGVISRVGQPVQPTPAWPDTTYPKTAPGGVSGTNLASVFCIAKTNSNIDTVSGLPGPGSLILPVKQCYKKIGQQQVCP